jgi:titin
MNYMKSLIRGNFIGTDASGTRPLGNGSGIGLGGWHVLIGGAMASEQNVISGNQGWGIDVQPAGAEYNWIAGNVFGTDASGAIPLGNGVAGVVLWDHSAHAFVQGNTIAFNGGEWTDVGGVSVRTSLSNTIRRNSIYSNVGGGIVLAEGGNNLLPAPVITRVTTTSVSGTACPGCTVEVFSDAEDEGRVYEGSAVANGAGMFAFTKPTGLTGPYVTATATDSDGNTSEFSTPSIVWRSVYLPVILKGW